MAELAEQTGLEITVCHFPPGTSKWNKIEHRLFSQITLGWRGRPLTSYDVIIDTISAVTTATGLAVTAALDHNSHPTGTKISARAMHDIEDRALTRHPFHGEWNYALTGSPAPAAPPPASPAPGPDPRSQVLDALACPELTGLARGGLDALAAALERPPPPPASSASTPPAAAPAPHPRAARPPASSQAPPGCSPPSCATATACPTTPWPACSVSPPTPSPPPSPRPPHCSPSRPSPSPPAPSSPPSPTSATTPPPPASPSPARPANSHTPPPITHDGPAAHRKLTLFWNSHISHANNPDHEKA